MKYFGWTDSVNKAFSKSFPADYDDDALCLLHRCITEEFGRAVKSKDEQSLEKLFFCLGDFYKHFCWKIDWKKNCLSSMKKSCSNTLSYLIQVGVILSKGKSSSKWVNSILAAMKVFPGPLELLFDSLILVYNIKEKFRSSFEAILKHFLFTNKLNTSEAVNYFKIMLLLRRLKFMSGNKLERAKVVTFALSVRVPSDSWSWLMSNGIKHLANVNRKLFTKKFLSKKLPPEFFKELRKALKVEVQMKENFDLPNDIKDTFVIDTGMVNNDDSPVKIVAQASIVKDDSKMLSDPSSHDTSFVGRKRKKKYTNSLCTKQKESILPPLCSESKVGDNQVSFEPCGHAKKTSGKSSSEELKIDFYLPNAVKNSPVTDTGIANDSPVKVVAEPAFVKDDSKCFADLPTSDCCNLSPLVGKKGKKIKLTKSISTEDSYESSIAYKQLSECDKEHKNITVQELHLESIILPLGSKVRDYQVSYEQCVNETSRFSLEGELKFDALSTDRNCESKITSVVEKQTEFSKKQRMTEKCRIKKILTNPIEDKSTDMYVNASKKEKSARINEKNKFLEQIQLQPSFFQAEDSVSTIQSNDIIVGRPNAHENQLSDQHFIVLESSEEELANQNILDLESSEEELANQHFIVLESSEEELANQNSLALEPLEEKLADQHSIALESSEEKTADQNSVALKSLEDELANQNSGAKSSEKKLANLNFSTDLSPSKSSSSCNTTHNSELSLNNRLEESSKQVVNQNLNDELNVNDSSSLATEAQLHKDTGDLNNQGDKLLFSNCLKETVIVLKRDEIAKPNSLVMTLNNLGSADENVTSLKDPLHTPNLFVDDKQRQNEINDKINKIHKGRKGESPNGLGHYIGNVLNKLVDEVVQRISHEAGRSSETSEEKLMQTYLTPNKSFENININKSSILTTIENNFQTFFDVSTQTLDDCKEYNSPPGMCVKSHLFDYRDACTELKVNINDVSTSDFPEIDCENGSLPGDHSSDEMDIFESHFVSAENSSDKNTQWHDSGIENRKFFSHSKVDDSSLSRVNGGVQSKQGMKTLEEAANVIAKLPHSTVEVKKQCDLDNDFNNGALFTNCIEKTEKEFTGEPKICILLPAKTENESFSVTVNNDECILYDSNAKDNLTNVEEGKHYVGNAHNKIVESESDELLERVVDPTVENSISNSSQVFLKELPELVVCLRKLENNCDTNGQLKKENENKENVDIVESSIKVVKSADDTNGENKLELFKQLNQLDPQGVNHALTGSRKNGNKNCLRKLAPDHYQDSPLPWTGLNSPVKQFNMTLRTAAVPNPDNFSSSLKVRKRRKQSDCSDPTLTSNLSRLTLNSPTRTKPFASQSATEEAKQKNARSLRKGKVESQTSDNQPESKGYNLRSRKPLILPGKLKYPK